MMQRRVFRVWRSSIAAAAVVENLGEDVIASVAAAEEEPMVATPIKFRRGGTQAFQPQGPDRVDRRRETDGRWMRG